MDSSFILSRIITELIFPGLTGYLTSVKYHASFSCIAPARNLCPLDHLLKIRWLNETVNIKMSVFSDSYLLREKLINALNRSIQDTAFILQVITGRDIRSAELINSHSEDENDMKCYQYTIALRNNPDEIIITLNLEPRFFNIIIPSLDTTSQDSNLSETLISFFQKPGMLIPSIKVLLEKLDTVDLSEILDVMKRKNELSDYQLVLLINGFPEYSLKIKKTLSKNRLESLKAELARYTGRVTKEDIACGIYSVEESLGDILKNGGVRLSQHFMILSQLIKKISDYELYSRKGWNSWIEEITGKNLIYKTILKCNDILLRKAFDGYNEERYPFFKKYFTDSRIDEIFKSEVKKFTGTVTDARILFIKTYRNLIASSFSSGDEHFSYLLSAIKDDKDFEIILRHTGWFLLSTSLKQCSKKLQERVLRNINYPASALIRGVLSGTINQGIIHDDVQVNRARNKCARIMLSLFEDGIIDPDI